MLHIAIFKLFHNNSNNALSINDAQIVREWNTFLLHQIIHNQFFENEKRIKKIIVTSSYAKNVLFQTKNMFKIFISFFVILRVITTSSSFVCCFLLALYDLQNSMIKLLRFSLFEFIFVHKKKFEQRDLSRKRSDWSRRVTFSTCRHVAMNS
jgi:hypothetical protein